MSKPFVFLPHVHKRWNHISYKQNVLGNSGVEHRFRSTVLGFCLLDAPTIRGQVCSRTEFYEASAYVVWSAFFWSVLVQRDFAQGPPVETSKIRKCEDEISISLEMSKEDPSSDPLDYWAGETRKHIFWELSLSQFSLPPLRPPLGSWLKKSSRNHQKWKFLKMNQDT